MTAQKRSPRVIEMPTAKPRKAAAKTKPAEKPVTLAANPADAPPVPDTEMAVRGATMQVVTKMAARKPSRLWRLFFWSLATLLGFAVSLAFWDFVTGLMDRNIWLGRAALGLLALLIVACLLLIARELASFARLRRIDGLRAASDDLRTAGERAAAVTHAENLLRLYRGRDDLAWAVADYNEGIAGQLDATCVLDFVETTLMPPLDTQATDQIEAASRQVATATAIVPLALADVVVALTANIRMIRRIAEIYGGRAGSFGSWRLMRAVAAHLVATGAVAIGDDLIGSVAGGGVLSKVSRRFGEGIINGALTARVGIAAMEVCRPMPFVAAKKPRVTALIKRALTGLFG